MHLTDHALIGDAAKLPASRATPVQTFSPVRLAFPDRRVDLQLKVSAPSTGDALPIILLSHGHGLSNYLSSLEGYTPIADYWAGHGFVVIQPTHLSSKSLGITLDAENYRDIFMESRAKDMTRILDRLDDIEEAVPFLKGRLDKAKVAVAGHSLGGITASILLGATNTDPRNRTKTNLGDKRIKAGVVFGTPGKGGESLSETGAKLLPFYEPDFSTMETPTLIVWGDEDVSPHLSVRDADWHRDPYDLAPGSKASFMVKGGKHGFGGISGWDAGETLDESPERLGAVQRMTAAYIRSQLYPSDNAWEEACKALEGLPELGKVESK